MAKLVFYPIGNADSTLIHLSDNRIILKDFCNASIDADEDNRVNLEEELRSYLSNEDRDFFDVVIFTHADNDHVLGSKDFFWFEHSSTYQGDNRIKIKELHVPATLILEPNLKESAKIIRQEARYRLKEGKGIRVYGKPEQLEAWLDEQGIKISDRINLISTAGSLVPGFSQSQGQIEIFIHSPFSFKIEEDESERNNNSIVLHITLFENDREYRCILGADAQHETWADIVYLTELNSNQERLSFDLFRISHHCSYTALAEEKGEGVTIPRDEVDNLFSKGEKGCILISSSDHIPDEDTDQPPHRQTAAYYRQVVKEHGNEDNFFITMEYPKKENPRPMIVETSDHGFITKKNITDLGGISTVIRKPSRKVG
jgi:hypothetical protein